MSFRVKHSEVEESRRNTFRFRYGCLDFARHDERKPEMFHSAHMTAFFRILLRSRDFASGQPAKRLDIFGRTFFDHFLRQTRGR
jgi:hypothetical protein